MKTKYIVAGKILASFEEVEQFCKDNNLRIVNTTTLPTKKGKRYIIDVKQIN